MTIIDEAGSNPPLGPPLWVCFLTQMIIKFMIDEGETWLRTGYNPPLRVDLEEECCTDCSSTLMNG